MRDAEGGDIATAALLIDVVIDHDARIAGEVEGGLVVESDAERCALPGRQHVVLVDRVADFQRQRRGVGARHRRVALDGRDLADRIVRGLLVGLIGQAGLGLAGFDPVMLIGAA